MHDRLPLDRCVEPDETINLTLMAQALGVTPDALRRVAPDQPRLRAAYAVISIVRPWVPTTTDCWAWYRGRRLDRFDGLTPAEMVHAGRVDELKDFLRAGEALLTVPPPETLELPDDVRPAVTG